MPPTISIRNQYLSWLICVVTLAGCRDQVFDPTEKLPAYPGVSSQLRILEGQEQRDVLKLRLEKFDEDQAVVVQQLIQNDTDERLALFQSPRFQAEHIVVRTIEGDSVPLSAYSRQVKQKWQSGNRGDAGGSGIFPDETQRLEYILTKLFDLSEPGTYTVEIESRYKIHDKPVLGFFETDPEPITFEVK